MAYNELIKNFERIRDYMRQFYVYGFKSRTEYDQKSSRSYDNERRRIESWLGAYMSFRQDANGKNVFLSVDSRSISQNPLHNAFKAKSFTPGDITLHFYLMDLLADGNQYSTKEIVTILSEAYYSCFENIEEPDESTVRKKLKEYVSLGLLKSEKQGKELLFSRNEDHINLNSWKDAIDFYTEADPLGVIGSYFPNSETDSPFRFKHHYILHTLDSQILCDILLAVSEKRYIDITIHGKRDNSQRKYLVYPLKIYISTQTGRQYLLGYQPYRKKPVFYRLDNIHGVKMMDAVENPAEIEKNCEPFYDTLWGASLGNADKTDHIEMIIKASSYEKYIVERLEREKRNGTVEKIGPDTYRYTATVYDATELVPWLRTFIGRIVQLKCSNSFVTDTFYQDLDEMVKLYGGEENDIS